MTQGFGTRLGNEQINAYESYINLLQPIRIPQAVVATNHILGSFSSDYEYEI
jgi:hypothetical protein